MIGLFRDLAFRLFARRKQTVAWDQARSFEFGPTVLESPLSGVTPYTQYEARVMAENEVGRSDPAISNIGMTKPYSKFIPSQLPVCDLGAFFSIFSRPSRIQFCFSAK